MSAIQQLPYLLFDIGGSNTRLGYSVDGSTIKDTRIFKTPKSFEEGIVAIAQTAREMVGDEKPVVAAGGVAGVLSLDKTKIIHSPHLPGWNEKALVSELSLAFGTRVFLENDTALVGLGESFYGAAQNRKIVVYITISTGVNGVRLTNNQIDPTQYGFEVGHQIVDFDRSSGKLTLEDLIGGAAIERRYGKAPQDIDDPAFWEEMARLTSVGVANMILHWSPEIVVIGGSVLKKLSLERIKMNLKTMLTIYPELPVIAKASLGDLGGLWGALHYLNTKKEDA
jgi:predicted NBD/HSP70 family sugar kinase